jgi:hypothetical protein
MNVLTITGRIVDGPVHRSTPDAEWCEFRLAIDVMPWLEFSVRVTASTAVSGGTPAIGSRVTAVATLRRNDWVVRNGTRVACWSADASTVTVIEDNCTRNERDAQLL